MSSSSSSEFKTWGGYFVFDFILNKSERIDVQRCSATRKIQAAASDKTTFAFERSFYSKTV